MKKSPKECINNVYRFKNAEFGNRIVDTTVRLVVPENGMSGCNNCYLNFLDATCTELTDRLFVDEGTCPLEHIRGIFKEVKL